MDYILVTFFMVLLHSTICVPQTNSFRMPDVDFSTAQEINSLEPSPTPQLENRFNNNNGNFLEATLEEVQNILKASPDLPRLTKGEILDLIENITKQDMEKLRNLNKNRIGKSVLLVMPYSPNKNGETMEDLFTKRPVTELIDNENRETDDKKATRKKKPTFSAKKEVNRLFGRNATKTNSKFTFPTKPSTTTTSEIPYDTTSPMTTESSTVATVEVTTFRRRVRPPRTRPPTTTRPTRRRRRTTFTPTTTELERDPHSSDQVPNGQMDKFLPENAIRVTRPPVYYRFTRRTTTTEVPDLNTDESHQDNVYVKYPPNSAQPYESVGFNPYSEVNPQPSDELTRAGPVFKPISNQLLGDDKDEFRAASTFKPLPGNFVIPDGFESILRDLNLDSTIRNGTVLEDAIKSNTIFPRTTTTTSTTPIPITPMPEFGEVADNLSPDMRILLMTFGLIPNPEAEKKVKRKQDEFRSEIIQDNPESYVGFKPIPEDGTTNKDLDSLLASFGLGRNSRKSKKIKKRVDSPQGLDLSVVPESMLGIVTNLGLRNEIATENESSEKNLSENSISTSRNDRIDDPYENENISAEDIENINNLPKESVQVVNSSQLSNDNETFGGYSSEVKFSTEEISTTETPLINDPEILKMDDFEATMKPIAEKSSVVEWTDGESKNINESNVLVDTDSTTKGTLTSVVFNPTDQKIVEKEKEQLDKLVELIKTLKRINGSATEEDFEKFDLDTLREFTKVLNDSQKSTLGEQIYNEIDPLNNDEDTHKSKPKRQEITTETTTITPQTAAVTESKEDTLSLEESFGKLPEEEIETSTARKYSSGVYYMIDWNTFLDVDNTKGTHVNLRFQPKVGDPGRFYSVNNN